MTEELFRVYNSAIEEYEEKGLSFTMDDLAKRIGISKKTLYQVINSKEEVINLVIDETRKSIKEKQREILVKNYIDVAQKIRLLLTVLPEYHNLFNYRRLSEIKQSYPQLYTKILDVLNNDWEPTFNLLNQGIEEGKIKKVNIYLFKEMYVAALTSLYSKNSLFECDITYKELIEDIISILLDGIIK